MPRTFSFPAVLLLAAFGSASFAAPKGKLGPDQIVQKLYKEHLGGEDLFFQTKSRAPLDRYFMKDLATLIWKDSVSAKGEIGTIDFDPFYGSQDPQVTDRKIHPSGWAADAKFTEEDKASVEVTFKNGGKRQRVIFAFDQDTAGVWKIDDIRYPDDSSLREIFAALPPAE